MPSWKRQRKGSQSLDLEEKKVKESITAAAAAAHAAAAGPDGDGGVLVEGQAPPGEIFREPAGFDAWWAGLLQPAVGGEGKVVPLGACPISWATLYRIQLWDQARGGEILRRLTPRHFERNAFDGLNVGMAVDLFHRQTIQTFQYLREYRQAYAAGKNN
jgi:hypothetical protein